MPTARDTRRRQLLRLATVAGASAAGLASWPELHAETNAFPSRPFKFIVAIPPGGGADVVARYFAKKLTDVTGQGVVVENKAGANGLIGVQAVLSAAPDGYTIFIGSNSPLSTNAAVYRKLPYDPLADFAPLSLLARGPMFLIVAEDSPYRTFADLVAAAQKRPGALNYATGTPSYTLYTEWLNGLAKMKTTPINYKGSGEILAVVMGHTVDFALVDETGSRTLVQSGRLRALMYTGAARTANAPDVPTGVELGYPEYLANTWVGAVVSSKVPQPTVDRLAALFAQIGAEQETRDFFKRTGGEFLMAPPAEMRHYQATEIARWKRLVAVTGMELQ